MNKKELVEEISKQRCISKPQVRIIITQLLRAIYDNLQEGDEITLRDFGTFHMVTNASRRAYNISTRSVENRPSTRRLRFKPSENFKNRVKDQGETKIPKINESIKIEYCGTVSIDRFLDIFERDKYPTLKTPLLGAKILKPQQLSQKPAIGYTEPLMLEGLRKLCEHNTDLRIIENVGIPISGYYRQYVPDFVLYHEKANLYIDIEVDEPYVIESRKPIHYIDGRDLYRDQYIINNGWVVIRYSERQVYKHLDDTIKDLDNKIKWLTYDDPHPTSLSSDKRWTEEEAKRLAEENYRENYLDITTAIKENLIDENDYDELYEDSHQSGAGMSLESRWYNSDEALVNQIDYIVNALRPKYVRVTLKDSRQLILDGDSVKLNTHWYKSISGICSYGDTPGEQNKGPWKITEISKIEPLESLFTDFYWVQGKSTESELYNKLIEASLDGTPIWIKYKESERYVRHLYLTTIWNISTWYVTIIGKDGVKTRTTLPNYMSPFTQIGVLKKYCIDFYLHGIGIGVGENLLYRNILETKLINCSKDYPSTIVYETSLRTLICKEHKYEDDWKCIDYLIANKERFRIDDSVYQELIDKYELEKGNLD